MTSPLDILRRYWGYDSFRECQAEIIDSVLNGRDTIGLLPTGGGKSITFQVPAMMLDGITIVVTPLISLMKDQIDNLRERDIRAVSIHSGQSRGERHLALDRVRLGHARIVYLSPERLANKDFLLELSSWDVSLIVVDEAHCISQWGYDFRPSYLRISAIRKAFPHAPLLALTASATPEVVADIADKLAIKDPAVFSRSFSRDNISYIVRYCEVKETMLLRVLTNTSGSAIVYVRSRERTARLAKLLAANGISADYYHAGLDPADKARRQDQWKNGHIRVMVATNAFGMGIDKPDVRTVIHHDLPPTLEEYYQEAGRAGRDGLPSFAVMLVSPHDKSLITRRLNEQFPGRDYLLTVYEKLATFLNVSVGSGYNQVYECNFTKFCKTFDLQPRPTLSALRILTRAEVIEYHDELDSRARLMITARKSDFYSLQLDPDTEAVLRETLRAYTGLFADYVHIDEVLIGYRTSLTPDRVYQALLTLSRMHVVSYVPKRTVPFVLYPTSRDETRHVVIPREVYEVQLERVRRRMEAMRQYAYMTDSCRVRYMLRYFGQTDAADCGKCDVCRSRRKSDTASMTESVRSLLASSARGVTLADMRRHFPGSRFTPAISALRRIVDEGQAAETDGVYTIVNKC
ncbi:MAG: ATP-dependent DNA helicase RecQ [Bacteroidales bacterium]|nr:ATP-dependent DNA helicase RecQ [Bacteroidales bacterium]